MPKLTIFFTSDTHGYLYNTTFADTQERAMGLLSMRFPKDDHTLVIDGGDTIQGSPLTYFLHEGGEEGRQDILSEAMNARGYDYVTLGNHDFNYGQAWLGGYLRGLKARCLCANVEDASGRLPVIPCAVHTLPGGMRIGLFGVVTHWVNVWEKKENLEGVRVTDAFEGARKAVSLLQSEGVDCIIGIYHGGFEKSLEDGRLLSATDENQACRICEELPVDLLLTGHQHIPMAGKTWHGTHVVQTPCNARAYVRVDREEDGSFRSELVTPPAIQTLTPLENTVRRDLEGWLDRPIGHLEKDLWPGDKLEMALHGTGIADFFNRVQLWATGADLSLTMLPNECRGFAREVTVRDVVATYVYPNTLCVLRATGRDVRAALEQTATYFAVGEDGSVRISEAFLAPKEAHFNYDYFAGIDYAFDLSRPAGSRVVRLQRNGRPLEDGESLSICMCDYRATGSGDYPMWAACPHERDILTEVSELILRYFAAHDSIPVPEPTAPVCLMAGKRL